MALAPEKPSDPDLLADTTEQRPTGPLNVDSSMQVGGDVVAGEEEEYVDAFGWRTVAGALFIGLIMMPGSIYLGLIAGQGMGPAAEWVTIILFMEIARRSFQTLKKQEIFLLYYIGAALTSAAGGVALFGGPFASLIWTQYVVHTPTAQQLGITQNVPTWVVPRPDSQALLDRTFIHADWIPAIAMLMAGQILGRMNSWGLGYVLFRITSDIERLPFPLAPITAEGASALAESSAQTEGWRWRIFSIGAMIGVGWGVIYILLPAVTGLVFAQPITIVTNPFIDLTQNTQKILPAARSALGTDISWIFLGFVLPLPVVIGTFAAAILCQIVANPILYHAGILHSWTQGTDVIQTSLVNSLDFWLSFSIGTSLAVAVIGIGSVLYTISKMNKKKEEGVAARSSAPPPGRGDFSIWLSLGVYAVATVGYIVLCKYLVPSFPTWILIFFGFIWTPIFSYVSARMAGMAGSAVDIPFVKEASFMLAGDRSLAIWFAPIPLNNFGGMAQQFRIVELTKTKFTAILKVELMMLPIILVCSLLFWSFIWKLAPIPSAQYPFAAKFWPVNAQVQALWYTANRDPESNPLLKVINPHYIGAGGALAMLTFLITSLLGLPQLLFYGIIAGTQTEPAFAIPMMIGALLGHYYFRKRYGVENWRAYAPVLAAGYYCGMGLIGMAAVSLALLSKSVSRLPF